MGCVSASGEVLCPALVYQGERCKSSWHEKWPQARAAANSSGYMTTELFIEWAKWFVVASGASTDFKRRVLFLDNHKSHLSTKARKIFKAHNVQLVSLHPHTTHVFCVLDVAIFATFKAELYRLFTKYSKPGAPATREELTHWMRKAYKKATRDRVDAETGETFNPSTRGFAKVGLIPFKPKLATDVVFAHHNEWIRQKEKARVEAEGAVVVDQPSIYAMDHEERLRLIESLKKDDALAVQLAKGVRDEGEEPRNKRPKEMSQLLTSDERMEIDQQKEDEKEAEEARLEEGRKQRAEEKAARGGLTKGEWKKKVSAEAKAKKLAEQAAAEAAKAAAAAAVPVVPAAKKAGGKKAPVGVQAPKGGEGGGGGQANIYAKPYGQVARNGDKRPRE